MARPEILAKTLALLYKEEATLAVSSVCLPVCLPAWHGMHLFTLRKCPNL